MKRAALGVLLVAASAHAEPSNQRLVLTGLALAPPTYLLDVSMHEGSHAVAALIVGAEVEQLHLFPPGRDPSTGTFRFGWTYVRGLKTTGDRIAFFVAPKVTDSVMIGGFAALAFSGAWPGNRYAALTLTVLATGWWIDFAKDVVLFSHTNDVVRVFDLIGATGWKQWPARLVYAGAAVGLGFVVAKGYRRTFERTSERAGAMDPAGKAVVLPLMATAF